jgi:hypothetical protein
VSGRPDKFRNADPLILGLQFDLRDYPPPAHRVRIARRAQRRRPECRWLVYAVLLVLVFVETSILLAAAGSTPTIRLVGYVLLVPAFLLTAIVAFLVGRAQP